MNNNHTPKQWRKMVDRKDTQLYLMRLDLAKAKRKIKKLERDNAKLLHNNFLQQQQLSKL
jgi:hypothetical protein